MGAFNIIVELVGSNPPTALCILGGLGVIGGSLTANLSMIDAGWILVGIGAILQVIYLMTRVIR